jgi:hypothetical protein
MTPPKKDEIFVSIAICELKHKEVTDLKDWVSKLDGRLWALLVIAIVQLVALGGILVEAVSKR